MVKLYGLNSFYTFPELSYDVTRENFSEVKLLKFPIVLFFCILYELWEPGTLAVWLWCDVPSRSLYYFIVTVSLAILDTVTLILPTTHFQISDFSAVTLLPVKLKLWEGQSIVNNSRRSNKMLESSFPT